MIEKGKKVTMNYTVKILNDSEIFESTQGSEPFTFTYGEDRLIEGLEESLLHKNVGDKFTAEIEMKMAYGPIREELFVKLDPKNVPSDVKVGDFLDADNEIGEVLSVTVKEVTDEYVVIDANHLLAGKDLVFDIEILNID